MGDASPELTATPARVAFVLPASWVRLDLDSRTRGPAIARLVGDRLGDESGLVARRRELTAALRAAVREAAAAGAMYAAVLTAAVEGTALRAAFTASLVGLAEPAGQAGDPTADARALADLLAGTGERSETELPLGPAAQLVTEEQSTYGEATAATVVVQYAVRTPPGATPDPSALVLSFSTPDLPRRAQLLDVFAGIAAAARWRPA